MVEKALYKYLPSEYVEEVMEEGSLLFRTLSYFRQIGGEVRGDDLEGLHMDKPDDGFEVIMDNGKKLDGKRFVNSIDPEKVYVFCLSERLEKSLYDEFECNTCIRIHDVDTFLDRCKRNIKGNPVVESFHYGSVEYYDYDKTTERDIQKPENIPLFKHSAYSNQEEFRLYFAMNEGLELDQKIIVDGNPFNLSDDGTDDTETAINTLHIKIGDMSSIATVIHRDSYAMNNHTRSD